MPQSTILSLTGAWLLSKIWDQWNCICYSTGYRPDVVDFPCYDNGKETLDDYVNRVIQICLGIESATGKLPILFAHSMGGAIGQSVASKLDIPRLVLICSAATRGISNLSWPVAKRMAPYMGAIIKGEPFQPSPKHARELIFNNCPNQFDPAELIPVSGRAMRDLLLGTVEVPFVRCPCLVVGGERDNITPLSIQRQLGRKYNRHYDGFITTPYGHMPMLEDSDGMLIKRILEWIQH
jgi:pimeloyl-ACP methyl ester carboxylesterase